MSNGAGGEADLAGSGAGVDRADDVLDFGDEVALPPAVQTTIAKRALLQPASNPIRALEQARELAPRLVSASIQATLPQDWIIHGKGPDAKVYLQAQGAQRGPAKMLGLKTGAKLFEREDHEDGTFSYICTVFGYSSTTGALEQAMGARWSGDAFFDRFDCEKPTWEEQRAMTPGEWLAWRMDHRLPVDPMDVRKCAETNAEIRLVSKMAGLRGLTVADLARHGVTPKSAVTYDGGGKGGKAAKVTATGVAVVPFATKNAPEGTPLTEISVALLDWYYTAVKKNLDSPDYQQGGRRFRYRSRQEHSLKQIEAEMHRRADADAAAEAP